MRYIDNIWLDCTRSEKVTVVVYKNCNLECCSFLVHSPDSICYLSMEAMEDMLMILGGILHEVKKVCYMLGPQIGMLCFLLSHLTVFGNRNHLITITPTPFEIYIYTSVCCYIVSFNLIHLVVCNKMSKTDFQDGHCGGPLGFPIDTILAHFDTEVVMLLQSKFRLKSTKGLGRDVKN